jgi:CheY-like chemotaxis protein
MANILVVDDCKAGCRLIASMLKQTGHDIHGVCNGIEALAYLETNPVDIVITDIDMPGMDGITLCKEIKSHEVFYPIPVVIATAHHSNSARFTALEAGASKYLTKPLHKLDLVDAVTHLVQEPV